MILTDEHLDLLDDEALEAIFSVIYADVKIDETERYQLTEEGQ